MVGAAALPGSGVGGYGFWFAASGLVVGVRDGAVLEGSGVRELAEQAWCASRWSEVGRLKSCLGPERSKVLIERAAVVTGRSRMDAVKPTWLGHSLEGITFELSVAAKSRVHSELEYGSCFVDVRFTSSDFDNYFGVELGLRLVLSLESALEQLGAKGLDVGRASLGRTKRELEFVGERPLPVVFGSVRQKSPATPMSADEFWPIVQAAQLKRLYAIGLRGTRLDAFRATAKQLAMNMETRPHREAAESVLGPLPGDAWTDVKGWVISRGYEAYVEVVGNAAMLSSLLELIESQDELSIGEFFLD